jgi:hypothetical protein
MHTVHVCMSIIEFMNLIWTLCTHSSFTLPAGSIIFCTHYTIRVLSTQHISYLWDPLMRRTHLHNALNLVHALHIIYWRQQ